MRYPSIFFRRRAPVKTPPIPYDWYVDGDIAVSGNGKTSGGAFKTLAELQAVAASSERIWIEKIDDGSPYRDELDLSALNNVSIYSSQVLTPGYDAGGFLISMTIQTDGAKIDCRDIIANATFAKTGGQTNVYEKSVTFQSGVTDAHVKVWEDGTPLTLVASVAACDGAAGSYYIADHSTSPQTVYVHASDSSDVTANGKQYEYNPRPNALLLGANCTVQGITTAGNMNGSGSLVAGSGLTGSHFVCADGTKHNLYHGEGFTLSDFWLHNAYWKGSGATLGVYNMATATDLTGTCTRGLFECDDGFGTNNPVSLLYPFTVWAEFVPATVSSKSHHKVFGVEVDASSITVKDPLPS